MYKTCSGRREKIPVDAGIPVKPFEGFYLCAKCICYLPVGECIHGMCLRDHGYRMPVAERKEVGDCDTLTENNPVLISKCGSDYKDAVPAEWATGRTVWQKQRLIDMPFQSFWADPAPETGEIFPPVL
jgi:hypothetical protein